MISKWKENKWLHALGNKYVLVGVPFAVWMTFFDSNSWRTQRLMQKELDKLKESIHYFETELNRDRVLLHALENDPEAFEKYAREQFWMHRPGEQVYVFDDEE